MRYFILFILFINTCVAAEFYAYPRELGQAVKTALSFSETSELLDQIQKEGSVRLILDKSPQKFDACWNGMTRAIRINGSKTRSLGSIIRSIVFEMHNAKRDKKLEYMVSLAQAGKITRDEYVEGMERIEHQNALECQDLLERGYKLGIYPRDVLWNIPSDFQEHYAIQIRAGHSAHHAKIYDRVCPSTKVLSQQERYLALKRALDSGRPDEIRLAKLELTQEVELQFEMGNAKSIQLLNRFFSNHPEYRKIIPSS